MSARRSWTTKLDRALAAETPSELVALAKERGYPQAQFSQCEYAHSIGLHVMYNVKGSKMLADDTA